MERYSRIKFAHEDISDRMNGNLSPYANVSYPVTMYLPVPGTKNYSLGITMLETHYQVCSLYVCICMKMFAKSRVVYS